DFTSRIGEIREGFRATVDGPYGRFSYLNFPWEKSIFLIVGGVGITPALGMIRYMHSQDRSRHVTLVWGLNNRHEMISHDEIKQIQQDMPYFRMIPVMFKDEEWEGERGVIDQILLARIIERHGHDIKHTGFYVCGPLPMMKAVIPALKAIGVKRRKIHYEKFSL
ncbi:MAG TPA: FAD-dependent oxidoreductase, partial [Spirochaetota bacterium]|nr:FAD-dependent oxidoreductase [Spirochaetota bacterium]